MYTIKPSYFSIENIFIIHYDPLMKIKLFVLFFLFFTSSLFSIILETKNLTPIEQQIRYLTPNDLVLWDVDDTLITPGDLILQTCNRDQANALLTKHFGKKISKSDLDKVVSTMILDTQYVLIDPQSVKIIRILQQKKIPTLALTAAPMGNYGQIDDLADWRIKQLKKLGIDFTSAFPNQALITFSRLGVRSAAGYKQGVIFSSSSPKGDVLKAFLDYLHWKPQIIIFIDDNLRFLESVEKVARQLNIEFIGFHYSGALQLDSKVDPEIAEKQYIYLKEHGKWLGDQQAAQLVIK